MSFIQDLFDPATSAYNDKVRQFNTRRMSLAMAANVNYTNKGVAFRQAQWGTTLDQSIANSNVYAQQLKAQWQAFKGFEEWSRAAGAKGGLTGNESRAKRSGRDAEWLSLLAKRASLEAGADTTSAAAGALHTISRNKINSEMQARDQLGIRPAQKGLMGTRSTNWGVAVFNMAKQGASIATGLQGLGAFDKNPDGNNLFGWLRRGA